MGWMLVATNQELGRLLRHSAASEPEPAFHVFPSFVHISKIDHRVRTRYTLLLCA
jgi:hypothetical protein